MLAFLLAPIGDGRQSNLLLKEGGAYPRSRWAAEGTGSLSVEVKQGGTKSIHKEMRKPPVPKVMGGGGRDGEVRASTSPIEPKKS